MKGDLTLKNALSICMLFVALFLAWGAARPGTAYSAGPISTMVSIVPQQYFVEKIGGDHVHVDVMVPEGASPATFDPSPSKLRRLTDAALYFAVGVPFEKGWLEKFRQANPAMKIVPTQAGIERFPMGSGDGHHHGARDPHVWLSPPLVALQARNIMVALCKVDPQNRGAYRANYARFMAQLVDLDLEIADLFARGTQKTRFMVYHPSWGYFARAYGLEQVPVEREGKAPTGKALTRLVQTARQLNVKAIFVQPQFSTKGARLIAEAIGGQVVIADPLSPDWAANLRDVARRFRKTLR
jgi:zinc transport system substrate-binding protein